MAVKVEMYGSTQKKKCFGCGSVLSFDNSDIESDEDGNTFVNCSVCGKKIKARKVDYSKPVAKKETEVGKKLKQAIEKADSEDWD